MNQEELLLLAAYRDGTLCDQAAEQLAEMLEDPTVEVHKGEDLPKADRDRVTRRNETT